MPPPAASGEPEHVFKRRKSALMADLLDIAQP
jgi:hypothetical protein